ncbi:glyoxal oxidase N-terminus-domain-containing protein [Umbelopsis sp. AD052]|nr:glyoxal oxidase N-terminus-domain-containing protein [Umbelopsis sp. AD052]
MRRSYNSQFIILLLMTISMALFVFFNTSLFYRQDVRPDYSRVPEGKGRMEQIGRTGVAAMHAVLISEKKILIIDKAEWNEAQFDSGQSAFSVEYDIIDNTYRLLHLDTNTFCSGGGFLKNGTFISTGGGERKGRTWKAEVGFQSIRFFTPCDDQNCQWDEWRTQQMNRNRWYPSVEQMPEGDILIMGGSIEGARVNTAAINVPSIEYWPPRPEGLIDFTFLNETLPYNLYPITYVLPDGNLFVFANRQSIIYNYKTNEVVKRLPDLVGNPRSYPLTAASVMLPLDPKNNYNVEILICGGSEKIDRMSNADDTCARINLGDEEPTWEMDSFLHPRLMPDAVFLADGNVLFLNGCKKGFAGYQQKNFIPVNWDPTFELQIYDTAKPIGKRWNEELATTDIARMYHSVALTLPDGRVWIAGSNNNDPSNLTAEYPTEFRIEYFSPPYLFQSSTRPLISNVPKIFTYGQQYTLRVNLNFSHGSSWLEHPSIKVALLRPGFSTHSMHMSQRYVVLNHELSADKKKLTIESPPNANIFPPGPATLYVLHDGVPAEGVFLHIAQYEKDVVV